MSDNVLIAMVAGVVIVLVVFLLRERLAEWSASWRGLKTRVTARTAPPEPGAGANTVIRGNRQTGKQHAIDVARDAVVERNRQSGQGSRINVGPSPAGRDGE